MLIRKFFIAVLALLLSYNLAAQDEKADEVWFKTVRKLVKLTERVEALENSGKVAAVDETHHDAVVAQLAALQAELAAISLQIGEPTTEVAAINDARVGELSASCPAGQLLTGLTVVDTDKGRNCKTCISGVKLLCQPVAVASASVPAAAPNPAMPATAPAAAHANNP